MDKCYLCGKEFNDKDVKKHDEHIIQQAIGGNLTAKDILCSKCGGKLGREIDVPFVKIFEGIATRLDIKKDRKNNKKSSVEGKYVNLKYKFRSLKFTSIKKDLNLLDYQYQYSEFCNEIKEIDVLWQDFKVYPLKPFYKYFNKQVVIYGNEKSTEKYRKKVEAEIKQKFQKIEAVKIIECDDLIGLVEFPFEINDNYFKRGLAKIAIGFASSFGIKRENMPLVLDVKENKIKEKINSLPFYPFGVIDKLIELQKNEFEHYPFHNLILFTIGHPPEISNNKILICYIELFSTFQWYIVLNDNYMGESIPYEYYAQQILKKDDYKIEPGRRHYKERNIWLQPLGISEDDIGRRYYNQKKKILSKLKWSENSSVSITNKQLKVFNLKSRFEIEEELIQEETIKQKYKLDFESHLNSVIKGITDQLIISKSKKVFQKDEFKNSHLSKFINKKYLISEYEKVLNNFDNIQDFHQNMNLFFSQRHNEKYDDRDEIFNIESYRIVFYQDNQLNFYPLLKANYTELKKYQHQKFYMLEDYIQQETIKRKFK